MRTESLAETCRSCGGRGLDTILDLGPQPDPDCLLEPDDPDPAPEAPIELAICSVCGLVQLVGPRPAGPRPAHGHASPAPTGDPWVELIERSMQARSPVVCDVDGSSGLPVATLAATGRIVAGLPRDGEDAADLILVGHALAHADDLDALVGRIAAALAPRGLVDVDFHHVLGLAQGQFDVASHAHRSYLSLHSLERAVDRHGLRVIAAKRTADYGGTVRVLAAHRSDNTPLHDGGAEAALIRQAEGIAQIDQPAGYEGLERQVRTACTDLVEFLDEARCAGRTVAGYGAASRGTTLINLAGIGVDRLPFIVDRAEAKQGWLLPRARVPILAPSEIERATPDDIIILPWPVAGQITKQLSRSCPETTRYVVALPRLEFLQ